MALLLIFQQFGLELQNLSLFSSLSIFLLISISVLLIRKSTKTTKPNLPPSPPWLPIIGHLHQLGTLPHRSLQTLSKKHGPIMLMHLGHTPTLVISSAQIVKEMIKDHDITFSNRSLPTAAKIFFYQGVDIAFSPYGEYWRDVKKLCVLELLSVKRVQSFQYVRDQEVKALVDTICRACSNGSSVNLTTIIFVASKNIMCKCVLGRTYDEDDTKQFEELFRKIMMQFVSFCFGDFFPSLGWLDVVTGLISRLKDTFNEFDTFLEQVIEDHNVSMNNDRREKDFVDIILQLQVDNLLDFDLTRDKLKAILLDMVLGGSDTTSSTMEWAMTELMKNPTSLKKVQEEIRKVVGKNSTIEKSDINQMGYLKCVIKETLRLHPPIPLLVPRQTSTSVKLGGYDILPKTTVFINTWAIQRDAQHWDMPEAFAPERFENENTIEFNGQSCQYMPFGVGRRGCPGMPFGVESVEYMLANILHRFDWEMPNGMSIENLDMSEYYGLTIQKKDPLFLVPILYCACRYSY